LRYANIQQLAVRQFGLTHDNEFAVSEKIKLKQSRRVQEIENNSQKVHEVSSVSEGMGSICAAGEF